MEWQPIETAPKKGEYLVYQPLKKHSRSSANDLVARVVPQSHAGLRLATHWMPLPNPPEDEA